MIALYIIRVSIISMAVAVNSIVGYKLQEAIMMGEHYSYLDWLVLGSVSVSGLACVYICYMAFLPITEETD